MARLKKVIRVITGGPSAEADGISVSASVRAVTARRLALLRSCERPLG